MAKCLIVSGTRVCDGSPVYRVNGRKASKPFPKLSRAEKAELQPIGRAIRAVGGVDPDQAKLATALLQAVMAVNWDATRTANSADIEQSVKLMASSRWWPTERHGRIVTSRGETPARAASKRRSRRSVPNHGALRR
jgi:hypothetical protein